jgi:hypothetical protein
MLKFKRIIKEPATWVAFVLGGIAALSFGFVAKILSPAAAVVNKVVPKS